MSVKAVRVKDIMGVMEEIAPKSWRRTGISRGLPSVIRSER